MREDAFERYDEGGWRGELAPACQSALSACLDDLETCLEGGVVLHAGRHCTVCVDGGEAGRIVVKRFGRQSWLKDAMDARRGSKARRSFDAAVHLRGHGVLTPEPLGYLERWSGTRLEASLYISRYESGTVSFSEELGRLFREDPETERFMSLLATVAGFVRAMHDAGFVHQDLGNQNILMRRDGDGGWSDLMVIDLNRGCGCDALTLQQRARDLSRLALPSDFLRVFLEMYWGDVPPPELLVWERRYRERFARHTASRRWRHPIRTWRERHAPPVHDYPADRDMWVWDARSGQALPVHTSRSRSKLYPLRRHLGVLPGLPAGVRAWRCYRHLLPTAFTAEVALDGRLGVALEPARDAWDEELALFDELGVPCAQVRFYRHRGEAQWAEAAELVRTLAGRGTHVQVCLLQDRQAVRDPLLWETFCRYVLGAVRGSAAEVELAHAINRVKWGIWDWREYRQMLSVAWAVADAVWPDAPLLGPAAIDFEYYYILAGLRQVPRGRQFAALSHHLYVDRRGAPENPQGAFATVEKAALALAIARSHRACAGRLVVSEVNWPLVETGVYSPVGAPYESPGERTGDPSVSEWAYACYLVRYLLLTLCSGFVERVYWWRLVAHGYGLVDGPPCALRRRAAFDAYARVANQLKGAVFERAIRRGDTGGDGVWVLAFRAPDRSFRIGWSEGGEVVVDAGVRDGEAVHLVGGGVTALHAGEVTLSEQPCVWLVGD
jgi:hypothetical protein